jgi:hypothetical protein
LASEDKVAAAVDLATLTGACVVALGEKIAGLMGNDDAWIDQVRGAADRAGERVWPLPLPADYRRGIDSPVADMKNVGPREGGTLTAGLFLQEFVDGVPWAHLDIAGPAFIGEEDGYMPRGGTGFGVRTLLELAEGFHPPAAKKATAKKATAKKATAKKATAKRATAKRATAKKATARKATARKATAKKSTKRTAKKTATKTTKKTTKRATKKTTRARRR